MIRLKPLELLGADDVGADDLHGLDDLVVEELPRGLGRLLALLLGGPDRDKLVAILLDDGLALAAVGGGLLELLVQLEGEGHVLEGGGRLDGPGAVLLGDLKKMAKN